VSISPRIRLGVISATVFAVTGMVSFVLGNTVIAPGPGHVPGSGRQNGSWCQMRAARSGQQIRLTQPEDQYLQRSAAAMATMMRDMQSRPSGDVDQDFVAQMIPHHQGAIQMAVAVLGNTQNVRLRRLAEEIIVTQREEILAMQLAISDPQLAANGRP